MNKYITIDGIKIGKDYKPYIIAEMSANHNGDISNAYNIIKMAKKCGADALKMQTYTPDTLTLNCVFSDFQLTEGLWSGQSLYQLYQSAFTPWEWHKPLFEFAHKVGITIFSSPFDNSAVDLLENLNSPAYKIASFEAIDLPLIKYTASTGKPLIISTGMANSEEIEEAIEAALESGCSELAVLHCVSGYPAPAEDYNLMTLLDMQKRFGFVTGLSDHTINNATAIASIALGGSIVEKHVTLDRSGGGADDSFSLEEDELKKLCEQCKIAWDSLGKIDYERKFSEKENIKFRRSLYFVKDMKKGDTITDDCIRSIRPGYGLKPKFKEALLGKKINRNINSGSRTSWDLIEKT